MNLEFIKLFSIRRPARSRALRTGSAAAAATFALLAASAAHAQGPTAPDASDTALWRSDTQDQLTPAEQQDLPHVALTSQIIFQVLAAEIALQRGQPAPAYQTYMALAHDTRDPRAAQRAAEIALGAQSPGDALSAARLWRDYAPHSERATQLDASLLVLNGKLDEAKPLLAGILSRVSPASRGGAILSIQALVSRGPDRIGGLHLLQDLLKNDLSLPEARLAIARQQLVAADQPGARKSLEEALRLKPDYEAAALLLASLGPVERKEAIDSVSGFVKQHPKARSAHVVLAQLYLADNQLDAAQQEFLAMRANNLDDLAPLMALGLIDLQRKRYDDAQRYLEQYAQLAEKQAESTAKANAGANTKVEGTENAGGNGAPAGLTGPDPAQAYVYLAQIAVEKHDDAGAQKWLDKVSSSSPLYVQAQVARAQLIGRGGKLDEARELLRNLPVNDPREALIVARADAGLLIDTKHYAQAETRLAQANKQMPDEPDILYDYAMVAEKNHHYTLMETLLRRLMTLQPESPQAYNALGYSLAERNVRLDEAHKLIKKATALAPTDPFIMDSLGWVEYRLNNKQQAVTLLRRALKLQPNAEIAAHLGEVLWSMGQQAEAKDAWRTAKRLEPDNDTLVRTLKQFQIDSL